MIYSDYKRNFNKFCRRAAACALALAIVSSLPPAAVPAQAAVTQAGFPAGPDVSAESSILMEADSGAVLFEKVADRKMLVASTTKILTALVVLDRCDVGEKVLIGGDFPAVEGSSMYLKPGETVTVLDLLYGLMLASGNDAAVALALHTAGSVDAFAELMNARASELGCRNSHFANPHGLDTEGHYACSRDLALIAREAMKNDTFRKIVSTKYINVAGRSLKNHNKLLWSCPGTLGIKTGFTVSAGRSLVSCAEREGMTLICVTLSAPSDWKDHAALYGWGFQNFRCIRVNAGAMPARTVPVVSGVKDSAAVYPAEDYILVYDTDADVTLTWEIPKFVYASVALGDTAGHAVIVKNGKTVKTIPILYGESVGLDESIRLSPIERIKKHIFGLDA